MSRHTAWNWLLSCDRKLTQWLRYLKTEYKEMLLHRPFAYSTCIVNLPKASKSLFLMAASISLILCGTIMSALCCNRNQVHH